MWGPNGAHPPPPPPLEFVLVVFVFLLMSDGDCELNIWIYDCVCALCLKEFFFFFLAFWRCLGLWVKLYYIDKRDIERESKRVESIEIREYTSVWLFIAW